MSAQRSAPAEAVAVVWFRRDLRLRDHPALARAVAAASASAQGGHVVTAFVVDPALWEPAGPARRAWLVDSLTALDADLRAAGGRLVVRHGDPREVLPRLCADAARAAGTVPDAVGVHVSADAGPYGRERDADVRTALAERGIRFTATGTPYAVGPGTLLSGAGTPFQVFSAFRRAWTAHGWPGPAHLHLPDGASARFLDLPDDGGGIPTRPRRDVPDLPPAGEDAARQAWHRFVDHGLHGYAQGRDRPDLSGTSQLSAHLKYGEIHPRTLLAGLARAGAPADDVDSYRSELCWREFYADVLWHRPASAREYLRGEYARMRYDSPGERLAAWQQGRTGYPFVDAGMRQMLAEGWMHNRVRMVVASFLVKDLHLEWQHGARWFMGHLRDGDLASNSHGWQWVAGSGTDAAPYFRVFNPVSQGQKFDPDGAYVRRYVPELRHLAGRVAHEPWSAPDGYRHGYPQRIVDHAAERAEALARLAANKSPHGA
ncbi:MAG: deoxyribodipyrimidine photo-lyase [Kineosporiaceae bacterium]